MILYLICIVELERFLFLWQKYAKKVYGVEIVEQAIEDAKENG